MTNDILERAFEAGPRIIDGTEYATYEDYVAATKPRTAKKSNKFNAEKVTIDGIKFDSKKEGRRYQELKLLERVGDIRFLSLQPRFLIIEARGSENKAVFTADFMYHVDRNDGTLEIVVEDVKSPPTRKKPDYINRRKMFKQKYPGYKFVEV